MIAVLSSNFHTTSEWIIRTKSLGRFDKANGIFTGNDGTEYIIVSNREQIYGWEFTGYEKSPDYETLEDLVKTRIR